MNARYPRPVRCAVLLLLLGTEGCLEQKVQTTVSADGSCHRTISVTADSGSAPNTRLPLPTDTTWAIRWEKQDTLRKDRFVWTASKKYPSLTALAEDTAPLEQPGKIRITIQADRSFRWFYTYIRYREIYHRFAPVDRIPPTAVMTQEDIRRFTTGEENDTLKRKVEEWKNLNVTDFFLCTLDTMLKTQPSPPVPAETVQLHREGLLRNMTKRTEIPESLAEYLPSVEKKDLFQENTSILNAKGLEALRRLFVNTLGTASARELPLGEAWKKTVNFAFQAAENDAAGDFENVVTLPGLFLNTNAGKLNGNTASWWFKRDQLELTDYEMHAESRLVNTWAFVVSGVLAVSVFALLLIPPFRKNRSSEVRELSV